ncbi:MAG: hypothetical protein V4475_07935 [Pseudomonadota bacterium]
MNLLPLSLALLVAQPAVADSPFNGNWVMDIASLQLPPEISVFSLGRGNFSRATIGPGFAVKADGRFHRIASDGYVDAVAVTVLGPRRVRETDRLGGRTIYVVTYDVSVDGRTMTARVVDYGRPDHKPIPTVVTRTRIDKARPGAPFDGRWQAGGMTTTHAHLTRRFRLVGNRFSNTGSGGDGYEAVIGGPPAAVSGDAATARSAVAMPDDHTIVERNYVDGVLKTTKTMTLLPDGRTIRVALRLSAETTDRMWLLRRE